MHLTPLVSPPAAGSSPGSYKSRVVGQGSSTAGQTGVRGAWQAGGPRVSPPRAPAPAGPPRAPSPTGELPPRRAARRPAESPCAPGTRMEPRLAPGVRVPALLLCLGKPGRRPPRGRPGQPRLTCHWTVVEFSAGCSAHLDMMSLACQSVCPFSRGCNEVGSGRRGFGI